MPSSNICDICGSGHTRQVPYDNHTARISWLLIKHRFGLNAWKARLLPKNLQAWLRRRLLFSPVKNILCCQECGYGRYQQEFQPGELEDFYHHKYFLAHGLERERWDDENYLKGHRKTCGQVNFIAPHLPTTGTIQTLDIGAGSCRIGRLLRACAGERLKLSAVEPGQGWHDYYAHHRITLASKFFPAANLPVYDLVTSSHWLEHVDALEPVLVGLRQSVRTGGLLFIEVPNCDGDYFKLHLQDGPHIHFFTSTSIRRALEQHGFEALRIESSGLPIAEYEKIRQAKKKMANPSMEEHLALSEATNHPLTQGHLLRSLFRAV